MSPTIEREKIAQRAYQIYEQRGKVHGSDFDDWMKAEQEMANREKNTKPSNRKKGFPY
jgi:hypothetical protein